MQSNKNQSPDSKDTALEPPPLAGEGERKQKAPPTNSAWDATPLVEKGIPIPAAQSWKSLFEGMAVGDSIVVSANRRTMLLGDAKKWGMEAVSRKISVGQYRVWRTK